MIYCSFEGRIGNNLFQLAACLSLATHHGSQACAGLSGNLKFVKQNFMLDDIQFYDNENPDGFTYRKLLPKQINNTFVEKKFQYYPDFFNLPDNTFIDGFFQSEKYFKNIKNKIIKNFTFRPHVIDRAQNIKYFKPDTDSGFIHVRRQDYLQETNKSAYPPISLEYYYECIHESKIDKIYIFSDEIDWCYRTFEKINNKQIIYVEEEDPYVSLYMMTQLKTAIIANSTFSWWGAWLGVKKKVYYPNLWYGESIADKSNMTVKEYIVDLPADGWIGK